VREGFGRGGRARLFAAIAVGVSLALGAGGLAHAAAPPAEFGTDWDDPRTAAPTVDRPAGPSCTVQIVDHKFADFTPATGTFTPPAGCAGPWRAVVLHMDGAVAGRQFDRLGYLNMGGVMVFKTSTPEPSVAGIQWSVEKDLTSYSALLSRPQPVEMLIGNVVDGTYTGVLDVQVYLTFYPARGPTAAATDVLPLANPHKEGTALVGDVTVPRNTEKLVAEVYATGSGGGCEEFWYLTTPTGVPYSCPADTGPYREVQVRVDGVLAGIAAPYPHIYTGGWSNPFLWYTVPAPRAFDIQPIRYDLTPFAGLLTDGRVHSLAVSVLGVPAGQSGWDVPTSVLAWRDPKLTRVTGKLVSRHEGTVTNTSTYKPATPTADQQVVTDGGHELSTTGYVDTSHGRVYTTVERELANQSTHHWTPDENVDGLAATWTDDEKITVRGAGSRPAVTSSKRRYAIDGVVSVDTANRLTTTITVTDAGSFSSPRAVSWLDDTYRGEASWLLGVPRDQRHAVGVSSERYRRYGTGGCYDHTIATQNGYVTQDLRRC
jgi:hypothetical protein